MGLGMTISKQMLDSISQFKTVRSFVMMAFYFHRFQYFDCTGDLLRGFKQKFHLSSHILRR